MSLATFKQLKIHINGADYGFSETYDLKSGSFTEAETDSLVIIDARRRLLAYGNEIAYAAITDKATKRDSLIVNGYTASGLLLDAETTDGTDNLMNDPEVGLLVRFDTGDGKYANRLFRAVRDSWVADNKKVPTPLTDYAVGGPYLTYATDPDLDASVDVIGNFFAIVRDYTALVRASGVDSTPYDLNTFALWQYRRVGAHQVGKRFGDSRGRQPAFA